MKEESACIVPTPHGDFFCFYTQIGLTRLYFPGQRGDCRALRSSAVTCPFDPKKFRRDLNAYLRGKKIAFSCPLDIAGTPFQKIVWKTISRIPYGNTWSYREIAETAGLAGAFRAIGNACGKNPVPLLIPCHRVVRSDGSPGGFSGGVSWKRALIRIEGLSLPLLK